MSEFVDSVRTKETAEDDMLDDGEGPRLRAGPYAGQPPLRGSWGTGPPPAKAGGGGIFIGTGW